MDKLKIWDVLNIYWLYFTNNWSDKNIQCLFKDFLNLLILHFGKITRKVYILENKEYNEGE